MQDYTLWKHNHTREIYIGQKPIWNLMPLERSLLDFLLSQPEVYLTKTELIENVWPPDISRAGVEDAALQELIYSTRRKLRKHSDVPYIINWRGVPEGGYRFFPNGQPDWMN